MSIGHSFGCSARTSVDEPRRVLLRLGRFDPIPGELSIMNERTAVNFKVHEPEPGHPWPGVPVERRLTVGFGCRDYALGDALHEDAVLATLALLRHFPDADAYMMLYTDVTGLVRKDGELAMAEELTRGNDFWDAERQPYRAMITEPYVVKPLNPGLLPVS